MNNRALDIAKELETMFMETPPECEEAAAELRRLIEVEKQHNKLRDQRNELLEALELFPGFTDDATIGDSWLLKVGSTIAKTGGAA